MEFVQNKGLGRCGICDACGEVAPARDKYIFNVGKCDEQVCCGCKKFLCDTCISSYYSQEEKKHVPYCSMCYEGLKDFVNTGDPKIDDIVSLHWLKTISLNNTIGTITAMPNDTGRYAVLISYPKKTLLVKKENIVMLDDTVDYHSGRWVCSFCGAECTCGAFDEDETDAKGKEKGKLKMHLQSCHHYMNTLRRKGPDCSGCEPMMWDCCSNQCNDIGCKFTSKDGPFEQGQCLRVYPGDMQFRFGPGGQMLTNDQRRAAAKKAAVDMWERVKAGNTPF